MAEIYSGMQRSNVDIATTVRNYNNILSDPIRGSGNAGQLRALMSSVNAQSSNRFKELQNLFRTQSRILDETKVVNEIIHGAQYVQSGAAENIVEGVKIHENVIRAREEKQEKERRGSIAYNLRQLTPERRRELELADEFGGGPRGARRARAEMAREAQEAYRWEMMTPAQREREDLLHTFYGNQRMVQDVLDKREKEKYLKGLPEFFRNSRLDTKTLKSISSSLNIAKGAGLLRGIPMGGGVWGMVAGAAIKAIKSVVQARNEFSKMVVSSSAISTNIENIKDFYGTPSASVIAAGKLAGMKEEEVRKKFGEFNANWMGGGEYILRNIVRSTRTMDPAKRAAFLKQYGIDENLYQIGLQLEGSGAISENREALAKTENVRIWRARMGSANAKWYQQMTAFSMRRLPDEVLATATSYWPEWMRKAFGIGNVSDIARAKETDDAARSAETYSASSGGGGQNGGNTVTIQVGTIRSDATSVESLIDDVTRKAASGGSVNGVPARVVVLDSFDSMRK